MNNLVFLLRKLFCRKEYLLGLGVFLIVLGLAVFATRPTSKLHLKFYDVGQGDAILIQTEKGSHILVDGGPNERILEYLSRALPFYKRTLDLVVLTHPHADHLVGLIEVLRRYEVKTVLANPVAHTTEEYKTWLELLSDKKIHVLEGYKGDKMYLGNLKLSVLWPEREFIDEADNLNDTSIVLLLEYGDFSALLTGDAERESQEKIKINRFVDVLKVPHQGAKDSLNVEFLEMTRPKLAVISVGKNNRYGHPSGEVLGAYDREGIRVLRTDEEGTVEVISDGKNWYLKKPRPKALQGF